MTRPRSGTRGISSELRLGRVTRETAPESESGALLYGLGVALRESPLMPVRVDRRNDAGFIEFRDLLSRQVPAGGSEVLAELLLVAGAHDDSRDGGALQQPVERDLRNGFAGFFCDFFERVHHTIQVFVLHRRTHVGRFMQTAFCGNGWPRRILPVRRPQPSGLQTS